MSGAWYRFFKVSISMSVQKTYHEDFRIVRGTWAVVVASSNDFIPRTKIAKF